LPALVTTCAVCKPTTNCNQKVNAVWDILELLSRKQREVERKYDYRYSVLIGVFGRLLYEGWIAESDLADLSAEKLQLIQRSAETVRELDA